MDIIIKCGIIHWCFKIDIEKGVGRMNNKNGSFLVDYQLLKYDELNPRLPKKICGSDDEAVIDYMVKSGNILELMKSIAETGYSEAEPLLVVFDGTDKKYIVVEGNRRLTAIKLLNHPQLAKVRISSINSIVAEANQIPQNIPVIVYDTRESVLDYLGYRHITGVKEWGALEKARYLEQLYSIHCNNENIDRIYTILAKMIGSRSDYVRKLHQALYLYNKANDEAYYGANVSEDKISFSWITTAIGYDEIVAFLGIGNFSNNILEGLNEENFKKLFIWMFDQDERIIKDSRQISDLSKIVSEKAALKKLEAGCSVDEAILYTSAPGKAFLDMLDYAKKYLRQARDTIEQLPEEPSGSQDVLNEIEKILKTIRGGLENNFKINENSKLNLTEEQMKAMLKFIEQQKK